ncbi:WXG100 family type VII secretion target [Micromonospora sp. NPDC005203]|uniref:WXG100 family type VII secretion target n=1 Tax=Micromonospora sp. NPDC005203 TaxID=3364226 RepID=UPI00368F9B4C
MANGNTTLDPRTANRVAGEHRQTAGDVDSAKSRFGAAVDLMDDYCDGAMIKALLEARENWMKEVTRIVADLNEMAGNVDGTVQDFDEQDLANAGQVGAIGVGILKDI